MNWEVRIMKSVMSFCKKHGWFNPTLFWKNVTRFWPIWVLYGVIHFFELPMAIFSESRWTAITAGIVREQLMVACYASIWVNAFFGILLAMALFSYLMSSRSCQAIHALPIRREGLLLTNYVSALGFIAVPSLVVSLLALGMTALQGVFLPLEIFKWLVLQVVVGMFFFSFGTCCAMFTGHILALPAFYGILNALVVGVAFLLDSAMDILLIGYGGSALAGSDLARWCTPIYQLTHLLQWRQQYEDHGDYMIAFGGERVIDVLPAVCYALVLGCAFTLIAYWVYQRRQLERAGDVVTVGWVRPVFQYGLGICLGLTLGIAVYSYFFWQYGPWAYIALVALWSMVGCFVGRALLKKTLRVLRDGWKGLVALGLAMLLLLGGVRLDTFGFQRRLPKLDDITQVDIWGVTSAPDDSGRYVSLATEDRALIAEVLAFHQDLASEAGSFSENGSYYTFEGDYQTGGETRVTIEYYRKDGSTVRRSYDSVPITAQALQDPDSYASRLQALLNRPEVVEELYLRNFQGDWENRWNTRGIACTLYDEYNGEHLELTDDQAEALWAAVLEDLKAGRFRRYLLDDRERAENTYYADLEFDVAYTVTRGDGSRQMETTYITITPQDTAVSLMKTLEQEGLTDYLVPRTAPVGQDRESAYPMTEAVD